MRANHNNTDHLRASPADQLNLPLDSLSSGKERGRPIPKKTRKRARRGTMEICRHCSKEFYVKPSVIEKGGGKYCSRKCYGISKMGRNAANWQGGKIEKKCLTCGKVYKVNRARKNISKYCSYKCKSNAWNTRIKIKCIVCGIIFEIPRCYDSGPRGRRFCTNECKFIFLRGKNNPKFNQIKTTCEICGKKFMVANYKKKQGIGRYCSQKCMIKWRKKTWHGENHPQYNPESWLITNCGHCGKKIKVLKRERERIKGNERYCSHRCHSDSLNKIYQIACLNCGELITTRPRFIEGKYAKMFGFFCCSKCERQDKVKNDHKTFISEQEKNEYVLTGKITRKCEHCGKNFDTNYSKIKSYAYRKNKHGRFCSLSCHHQNFWTDAERKLKRLKKIRNANIVRPTKIEKIIDEATSDCLRYVGDGKFWLSFKNGKHKNPDFKVKGQRKVVELWGNYWHQDQEPEKEIQAYNEAGFNCLIIWEKEIYEALEKTLQRINNFVSS